MMVTLSLLILVLTVLGIHLAYPLVLKKIFQKNTGIQQAVVSDLKLSDKDMPVVSIIIPVHNEELVIERRITNIFESRYPANKIEVIVVDSGSEDKTLSIIKEKFSNRVILIHEEERRGKAHAINLGLEACTGDIIIITDAPALYDRDTVLHLVHSLENPLIGGTSVLYRIQNAAENIVTASENYFCIYKDKIRIKESKAYCTSWLSGEACAFKKGMIRKVDEDSLADDSNIALQLISKGYRVVVNENSFFTERSPSKFYEYVRIKTRRTLGGLKEVLRFRRLLFSRQYSVFGTVIFPYRFFAQFISPVAVNIALIMSIFAGVDIVSDFGTHFGVVIGFVLLCAGLIFRIKFASFIYLQLISTIALFALVTKRANILWYKSTTTRN